MDHGAVDSVAIRIVATCPGCHRAVYLPGVASRFHCHGCSQVLALDLAEWVGNLAAEGMNRTPGQLWDGQVSGTVNLRVETVREMPSCVDCGARLDLRRLPAPLLCSCGVIVRARAVPDSVCAPGGRWLVGESSDADGEQVCRGERRPRTFWVVSALDARALLALRAHLASREVGVRTRVPLHDGEPLELAWPPASDALLHWLEHATTEQRIWLAGWPETPSDLWAWLASDRRETVRAALAGRSGLPVALQEQLAEDRKPEVALALLERGSFPPSVALRLACHHDLGVREAAARHPKVPVETVLQLAEEGLPTALRALKEREVDLGLLAASSCTELRVFAARQPELPVEALLRLLSDPDPEIARTVAARRLLPVEAAPVLLASEDPLVRRCLLACSKVAPEQLLALVDRDPELLPEVLARPECPGSLLDVALARGEPRLALAVARHPRAPQALLAELALQTRQSEDEPMMRALADRLTLEQLAEGGTLLRCRAASHPELTPEIADRLAGDPLVPVREALALRTDLQPALARTLLRDSEPAIQALVQRHPSVIRRGQVRRVTLTAALAITLACGGGSLILLGVAAWLTLP